MAMSAMTAPVTDRWFEDYDAGAVYEFPDTIHVTEEEILEFARCYDPQPIHIDPEEAARSPYKGIIASGVQTIALTTRLAVKYFLPGKASFGSPGFDELRWLKPLRPGDTIRVRITVEETKVSQSKPDRGVVFSFVETLNQHGEVIMSYKVRNLVARRPL